MATEFAAASEMVMAEFAGRMLQGCRNVKDALAAFIAVGEAEECLDLARYPEVSDLV